MLGGRRPTSSQRVSAHVPASPSPDALVDLIILGRIVQVHKQAVKEYPKIVSSKESRFLTTQLIEDVLNLSN